MTVPHLAFVLAGSGYGPAGPALLVPSLAAKQSGAEVRLVSYPDWRPGLDEERAREFVAIVAASMAEILDEVRPRRVTFLAKSLGCEVVARLDPSVVAAAGRVERVERVEVVWGTPVFALPAVRDGAIAKRWPSLVISGDADPWYDAAATAAVVDATGGSALILAGADHSLEVEGDVLATVDGFRQVAEAVLGFLDDGSSAG